MRAWLTLAVAFSLLALVGPSLQPAFAATTYSITVKTNASSYTSTVSTVTVSGVVTVSNGSAIGPNTAVYLHVTSPSEVVVIAMDSPVNASNGVYDFEFVTGGTANWVAGTYNVYVTWGAHPPAITNSTSFSYTPTVTTSSTRSTSSSSTVTTSSVSSVTNTTSVSSSSTTTTSSTSTTTSMSNSSTSSSSSSLATTQSSTAAKSSGIPEFPSEPLLALLASAVVVSAYLLARRKSVGARTYSQARTR